MVVKRDIVAHIQYDVRTVTWRACPYRPGIAKHVKDGSVQLHDGAGQARDDAEVERVALAYLCERALHTDMSGEGNNSRKTAIKAMRVKPRRSCEVFLCRSMKC